MPLNLNVKTKTYVNVNFHLSEAFKTLIKIDASNFSERSSNIMPLQISIH